MNHLRFGQHISGLTPRVNPWLWKCADQYFSRRGLYTCGKSAGLKSVVTVVSVTMCTIVVVQNTRGPTLPSFIHKSSSWHDPSIVIFKTQTNAKFQETLIHTRGLT